MNQGFSEHAPLIAVELAEQIAQELMSRNLGGYMVTVLIQSIVATFLPVDGKYQIICWLELELEHSTPELICRHKAQIYRIKLADPGLLDWAVQQILSCSRS